MAPEKDTVVLLEAVETTTDPTTPPDRPGDLKWGGPYGVIQPERLLANERQCSGATRLEQRLAAPSKGSLYAITLDRYSLREGRYALSCGLIGTARCGPACRVVWDPGLAISGQSRGPDVLNLHG